MCVYSMVGDFYLDKWGPLLPPVPNVPIFPQQPFPAPVAPLPHVPITIPLLTPEQLAQFHKDVEDLRELLKRAQEYDRKNNQPDCANEEKKEQLRRIAELFGVEIAFP